MRTMAAVPGSSWVVQMLEAVSHFKISLIGFLEEMSEVWLGKEER